MEKMNYAKRFLIVHEIHFPSKACIIKIYDAGALTNMPKAGKWFEEECVKRYLKRSLWSVFLCYDTDGYQQDIMLYTPSIGICKR